MYRVVDLKPNPKFLASLAFYLFSPTRLINSIIREQSCKIVYFNSCFYVFEPRHQISNNVVCATSKCAYAQSGESLCWSFEYSMTVKLLTEHHLEFLS